MSVEILRGHEVWLEPVHLHFHSGGQIEVKAFWGHMMRKDGTGRAEHWRAYALAPDGSRLDGELLPGEGLYHLIYLPAGEEGLYTVVVENDAGVFSTLPDGTVREGSRRDYPQAVKSVRCYQWARVSVPVGHHIHGHGVSLGEGHHRHEHRHDRTDCCHAVGGRLEDAGHHETGHVHAGDAGRAHGHGHGVAPAGGLDVVPAEIREFHPGDTLELRVFYRGRPLGGAPIKATYHLFEGADYPWTGSTDAEGRVAFTFQGKGHWMFIATHTDQTLAVPGEYDAVELTATLVIPGVR